MEHLIENIAKALGSWAYLLVAFMAMAETAAFLGFIAPGEFTIILGGVLAGEGTLSIELLIGIVWVSCVIGDSIGFMLGRRLGRGFALKHGPKVRLTEERLNEGRGLLPPPRRQDDLHRPLDRVRAAADAVHGRGVGHALPALPALRRARAPGLWTPTFCLLGLHLLAELRRRSRTSPARARSRSASCWWSSSAAYQAIKRLRHARGAAGASPRWLERQGERPVLRPLVRAAPSSAALWARTAAAGLALSSRSRPSCVGSPWLAPPLRFLVARLTPGELGIELTTLLAIAAVSIYIWSAADRPDRGRRRP